MGLYTLGGTASAAQIIAALTGQSLSLTSLACPDYTSAAAITVTPATTWAVHGTNFDVDTSGNIITTGKATISKWITLDGGVGKTVGIFKADVDANFIYLDNNFRSLGNIYADGTLGSGGSLSVAGARADVRSDAFTNFTLGTAGNAYLSLDMSGYGANIMSLTRVCGSATTATAEVSGTLDKQFTPVGNVGAGEDDLQTYAMPNSTLAADGQTVRITAFGTTANNGNAKTLKVYFGSTVLATISLATGQVSDWRVSAEVTRTGATTQIATCQIIQGGTTTKLAVSSTSPAETLSGPVTIKCTGTATADNDIAQNGSIVEWI